MIAPNRKANLVSLLEMLSFQFSFYVRITVRNSLFIPVSSNIHKLSRTALWKIFIVCSFKTVTYDPMGILHTSFLAAISWQMTIHRSCNPFNWLGNLSAIDHETWQLSIEITDKSAGFSKDWESLWPSETSPWLIASCRPVSGYHYWTSSAWEQKNYKLLVLSLFHSWCFSSNYNQTFPWMPWHFLHTIAS